jgi:putative acetyltransferase
MKITEYSVNNKREVKKFILEVLGEFGFRHTPELDYDLEDPKKYYSDTGGIFYVAKKEVDIVGTIAIKNKGEGVAELKRFYVRKNCRGTGIGRKLLELVIDFCGKKGFSKIILDSNPKFERAITLYKKNGFIVTGVCGSAMCPILMEKILT